MKILSTVLLILLCCSNIPAQRAVSLQGESADGKNLKLLWFLKAWEPGVDGFDIKRRVANGAWEKLNPGLIFPAISLQKSLKNVEPDDTEQRRLKSKLQKYILQKNIKEIPAASMRTQLTTKKDMMQAITLLSAYDYDLALLSGFGLVDRTAVTGNKYEYGLFFIKNELSEDNPAMTFQWTAGTTATLDPKVTINAKPVARTKRIQVTWKVDTSELKTTRIAGYNIYKQTGSIWKKLTFSPVANVGGDKTLFTYFDNTSLSSQNVVYGIAMRSMFGNEGKKSRYLYNASEHPLSYYVAKMGEIISVGESFTDGFKIAWTFPKEFEKHLKGFIVEKANLPQEYKTVSEVLPPTQRGFTDNSFSAPATYVRLRVTALYKDGEQLSGNEKMIFYLPPISVSAPKNLAGKWAKENDRRFISLSWNAPAPADSLIQGYQLYANNPFDDTMYLQSAIPMITGNRFKHEVFNEKAATYKFKIVPVTRFNTVGPPSDMISVFAPATVLSMPTFASYVIDSVNRVTLHWNYDTADVKGFRIFENEKLLADMQMLKQDTRTYTTEILREDEKYVYTIQAVSRSGFESRLSFPLEVLIYKKDKK